MNSSVFRSFTLFYCICCLVACGNSKKIASRSEENKNISSLKFLGEYDIPYGFSFKNTTVGGLSGIDYDAKNNCYYFICDDRSAINPARFYKANIFINEKGIDSIKFLDSKPMLQAGENVYPNNKQDPYNTPDPEAMRYDPVQNVLVWSSEGERIVKTKEIVLENPSVKTITPGGKYIDSFSLPINMQMQSIEKGPRQNGVFEGMTFADNYKTLFVNVEEPLYEDGPRADVIDNNALIRILKFDVSSKKNISQYAYKLEPVAYASNPANGYKINGVPDILSLGNNKLLIIERSFSTGRLACTIRIFIGDLSNATDIKDIASLKENQHFKVIDKKLLLNMDDLDIYIDNIEGVSFGPLLPNGHRSLIFVADNNFSPIEKSQLLLFEVAE